jgi:copper chaperone CopZ
MKTMKLRVEGIECRGCAEDYEKVLADMNGIVEALFDFNNSIIAIQYDPAVINRKQVYMAVRRMARAARILEET